MAKIYQLKITLNDSKPPIWRRLLVEEDTLISDLHLIIQTVMGWTNSHLHQFVFDGRFYEPSSEFIMDESNDYTDVKLNHLIKKEKDKIIYEYDFGDGWEHTITLEKILDKEENTKYPICIKGKRACPPEDCGGVWGYENLLEAIKDKKHPEHEDVKEWLGDKFDSEYFDINTTNELLQSHRFGAIISIFG